MSFPDVYFTITLPPINRQKMSLKNIPLCLFFSCFLLLRANVVSAQSVEKPKDGAVSNEKKHRTGSIYGSWGYNEESYTKSTIHVDQSGLGNNFDMVHVSGHDHEGWNDGITNKALTIPQYNYRLGYYFNDKQDLAFELNFDHTKYIIVDGTNIHIKGTVNHKTVDSNIVFSQQNGDYYYLNNGANFFLFNIVKRLGLYHTHNNYFRLDLTGKVGIGPVIPHVQNSFFGYANHQQFQLGGWNTGVEVALRATILRYAFIEFSQKLDYARYSHLEIYGGTAKQNFGTYETILSIGAIIPTTRHNPMFREWKEGDDLKYHIIEHN